MQNRRHYNHKIASLVVDNFVIDRKRNKDMQQSVQSMQQQQEELTDFDGRYMCRFPGCSKTFSTMEKLRKDHESKHNPHVAICDANAHILNTKSEDGDMLSYQRALYLIMVCLS